MIRRAASFIRHVVDALVWGTILAILSRLPLPRYRPKDPKRTWTERLLEAGVLFGALGLIGMLVVVSGLVPIKASEGHWAITRWFLEFSMARSIATHSIGIKPPPLNDPALIMRGAAQYDAVCQPCHGSPELRMPRVAAAMLPQPPYLPPMIPEWSPAQLFSIVKHGVKLTGMPAWPAKNRDDEVWAMVAFLQILPSLDPARYRRLAFGSAGGDEETATIEGLTGPDSELPEAVRERCGQCHGVHGRGRGNGAFPKLAGQHAAYLYLSLRAYHDGRRHSGIMEPVAASLSDADMRELARYYSGLEPAVGTHHTRGAASPAAVNDTAAVERGRVIAHNGVPAAKVPACAECHGPTEPHPRHEYPMLAGQYADYIVLQLELFKNGYRGGSPFAHLMNEVAPKLTEQQMHDVAAYYESLRR